MEFQEKVTQELKRKGFADARLLKNKALIRATIFETRHQIAGEDFNSKPKKIKPIMPKKVIKQVKKTDKLIRELCHAIDELNKVLHVDIDINKFAEDIATRSPLDISTAIIILKSSKDYKRDSFIIKELAYLGVEPDLIRKIINIINQ